MNTTNKNLIVERRLKWSSSVCPDPRGKDEGWEIMTIGTPGPVSKCEQQVTRSWRAQGYQVRRRLEDRP